jgi:transcriptional regulator with XRE-family HTH domain
MTRTLKDKIEALGPGRRKRVEARATELIAAEMSLRNLRQAHKLTQERMGKFLGISQDGISRLEKRSDLLLSTLRTYVEAMGGHLRLIAEFPDQPPVTLSGLADMENPRATRSRRQKGGQRANRRRLRSGRPNSPASLTQAS